MSNTTSRRRAMGQRLHEDEKPAVQAHFLRAFRDSGIIRHAAEKAGVARSLIGYWREHDPAFAAAFEQAEHDANDVIREEIRRRGVTGWIETTTTVETAADGTTTTRIVKTRKYSDNLIRLLAMARMPEYRDRLDVTSAGEQLGAYQAIASVADDPAKAEQASDLLNLIAGASQHTSRPGMDSEPG